MTTPAAGPPHEEPLGRIPTVRTDRLRLTALTEAHVEDLARICFDPQVARWYGPVRDPVPPLPRQHEEIWRSVALMRGHWTMRGFGQWAVEDRAEDTLLGRVGLWQPRGWPGIEVGWMIDPASQGQGYATEAARASMAWGFATLRDPDGEPIREIISVTVPHNAASRRVMEKLGLQHSGQVHLAGHDQVLYRISRRAWADTDAAERHTAVW